MAKAPPPQKRTPPAKGKPAPAHRGGDRPKVAPPPRDDSFKVCGLPAVQALFAANPDLALKLYFDERTAPAAGPFCQLLGQKRRQWRGVSTDELTKIAGTPLHGGIVAVTPPRPIKAFDLQEARAWARAGKPILLLDGVSNPHNLGAIVRTLAFFGIEHLVVSDHPDQALPSEAAWRVAEGGFEWLQMRRAHRFPWVVEQLKLHYRVIATALRDGKSLDQLPTERGKPVALIMGNEEHGLSEATLAACDEVLTLKGSGHVQSLNVSATAAILISQLAAGLRR